MKSFFTTRCCVTCISFIDRVFAQARPIYLSIFTLLQATGITVYSGASYIVYKAVVPSVRWQPCIPPIPCEREVIVSLNSRYKIPGASPTWPYDFDAVSRRLRSRRNAKEAIDKRLNGHVIFKTLLRSENDNTTLVFCYFLL